MADPSWWSYSRRSGEKPGWEQGRLEVLRGDWQEVVDVFPGPVFARVWLLPADAGPGHGGVPRGELRAVVELLSQRPANGSWLPAVVLAAVIAGPAGGPGVAARMSSNLFCREGEYWTVRYEGSVARVKDVKGLRYLARLLAHPGREFHAADLETARRQPPRRAHPGGECHARDLETAGPQPPRPGRSPGRAQARASAL